MKRVKNLEAGVLCACAYAWWMDCFWGSPFGAATPSPPPAVKFCIPSFRFFEKCLLLLDFWFLAVLVWLPFIANSQQFTSGDGFAIGTSDQCPPRGLVAMKARVLKIFCGCHCDSEASSPNPVRPESLTPVLLGRPKAKARWAPPSKLLFMDVFVETGGFAFHGRVCGNGWIP